MPDRQHLVVDFATSEPIQTNIWQPSVSLIGSIHFGYAIALAYKGLSTQQEDVIVQEVQDNFDDAGVLVKVFHSDDKGLANSSITSTVHVVDRLKDCLPYCGKKKPRTKCTR